MRRKGQQARLLLREDLRGLSGLNGSMSCTGSAVSQEDGELVPEDKVQVERYFLSKSKANLWSPDIVHI